MKKFVDLMKKIMNNDEIIETKTNPKDFKYNNDDDFAMTISRYPNAPCKHCKYRDRVNDVNSNGEVTFYGWEGNFCEKYRVEDLDPTANPFTDWPGKPDEILEGTKECKFYEDDA